MKLTNKALQVIEDEGRVRNLIAAAFSKSESTVRRWATKNKPNNALTTAGAVKIIKAETGLTLSEILTDK